MLKKKIEMYFSKSSEERTENDLFGNGFPYMYKFGKIVKIWIELVVDIS